MLQLSAHVGGQRKRCGSIVTIPFFFRVEPFGFSLVASIRVRQKCTLALQFIAII